MKIFLQSMLLLLSCSSAFAIYTPPIQLDQTNLTTYAVVKIVPVKASDYADNPNTTNEFVEFRIFVKSKQPVEVYGTLLIKDGTNLISRVDLLPLKNYSYDNVSVPNIFSHLPEEYRQNSKLFTFVIAKQYVAASEFYFVFSPPNSPPFLAIDSGYFFKLAMCETAH